MDKENNQKQAVDVKAPEAKYRHIVRIVNVDIPGEKSVRFFLKKIKGVGVNLADVVCILAGVEKNKKTGNLTDKEIESLNKVLTDPMKSDIPPWFFNRRKDYLTGEDLHLLTGNLLFVKDNDLKRLKKIKTLRGMRHQKGLPVRGQRTRSNFRRNKGRVVGVKKKGAPAKKK